MIVELNDTEVLICTQVAMMRNQIARAAGVKDKLVWKEGNKLRIETIGVMAELAFCKWANIYPELDVKNQSGTTDVIYQGWKCDIKATERADGQLMVSQWKKKESSDVYILGIIDANSVDFSGYALTDDIMQEANLKDLGYGPTFCMAQDQLTRFKDASQVA
jgi:hypothetical protein